MGFYQTPNLKTELGSGIHKVFEVFANCKKAHQEGKNGFDDDSIGQVSFDQFDEVFSPIFVNSIIRKSLLYYQGKGNNNFGDKEYRQLQTWVNSVRDFQNGAFDPRKKDIIEAEKHFEIDLTENWATYDFSELGLYGKLRLQGTIDLVSQLTDSIYEITDWKSGRRVNWSTGEEKTYDYLLNHDFQIRFYHYVVMKLFPHLKQSIFTIYYLSDGGPFSLPLEQADLKKTEEYIKEIFTTIKNDTKVKAKSKERKHFFCSRICGYNKGCYKNGKSLCYYVEDCIKCKGITRTVKEEKDPNFSFGSYVQS